ncbi:MAG: FadR family transcriptional regulator [Rhodospirillales bacterium]|nr:FadR family transcriptional regulator [Rhodospirillales bacterium]
MLDDDTDVCGYLKRIRVKRPADVIIEQVSQLVTNGVLKPGQRLPSERALMERFEVGRAHVREALHKLELYGIVRTFPQSGTVVEKISVQTLERLVRGVLVMEDLTPQMLTEVRGVLEIFSAELAATRATPEQIADIRKACEDLAEQVQKGGDTLGEDSLFHIRVAEATNNVLLRSLIGLIQADVQRVSQQHGTYKHGRPQEAAKEHLRILEAIEKRSPAMAVEAMRHHIEMGRAQFHED